MLQEFRDQDRAALFRFRGRLWPEGDYHRSPAYREWNVGANPHGGPQAWLAMEDGEAKAECQGLPAVLVRDGKALAASWCIELYAEPGARRRGLGSALVGRWMAEAGVPLVMGPSADSRPIFLKAGCKPLGALDSWVASTGLLARLRRPGAPRLEARPVPAFDPGWDPVWEEARRGLVHLRRDHAWLDWRFTRQPEVRYESLVFLRGGSPCGYAALRPMGERCRMADLAALPEALPGVLALCLGRARGMGARVLQFPVFAPSLEEALSRSGFRREGEWRPLLAGPGGEGGSWFVISADADQEHPG